MTTELPESTCLQRGQTLRMAVDAGFALLVTQGCVNVTAPPSWFGETMFSVKTLLDEGEAFVSERGGWIEVTAQSASRVRALPAPVVSAPVGVSRITRLFQRLIGGAA
ncbi:hypothetical protein [Variovorax ginsengisoli]|uniref:DUF2917 domain-containing protein n=1 Tax=Variovorax ginsengisoli TaxID=363844 RepID=A0ABT8RY06_9BURK|nr:hypothetical protein [Variovorax ginsengisoli]MDN8611968.1 hypothetical protein [Variovorax ginsengisoli]MDO1531138.1 hypothetical protein [Variovorax ginsengisoli]